MVPRLGPGGVPRRPPGTPTATETTQGRAQGDGAQRNACHSAFAMFPLLIGSFWVTMRAPRASIAADTGAFANPSRSGASRRPPWESDENNLEVVNHNR